MSGKARCHCPYCGKIYMAEKPRPGLSEKIPGRHGWGVLAGAASLTDKTKLIQSRGMTTMHDSQSDADEWRLDVFENGNNVWVHKMTVLADWV